jgi:hypothetical protein
MENQTEVLQTAEEKNEETQAQETAEHRQTAAERRKLHPVLFSWLTGKQELFIGPVRGDLGKHAKDHPHVKAIIKQIPSCSVETATKMAWLVWRAGQVQFWTRSLDKDTYSTQNGIPTLIHRGTNTLDWEESLYAAELRDESPEHEKAFARRAKFYADQDARREEEESIALTLLAVNTTKEPMSHADSDEAARATEEKKQELAEQPRSDQGFFRRKKN